MLSFLARSMVAGILLWILFTHVGITSVVTTVAQASYIGIAVAVVLVSFTVICEAQRWRSVSSSFGYTLSLADVLRYTIIGSFFDVGFPAVLGDDAFRVWRLRQRGMPIAVCGRIILADRLCALALLLVVITCGLPRLLALLDGSPLRYGVILAGLAGVAGLTVVVGFRFSGLAETDPVWRHAHAISDDLRRALSSASVVFWAGGAHLCRVGVAICLCLALGIDVAPLDVFSLLPGALLLSMLPITVGGWGVREAIIVKGFGLVAVPSTDALALSFLIGVFRLVVGVIGGLLWIGVPERKQIGLASVIQVQNQASPK
jgi:uncharacterized membrane protein YbhN (UPF0104 family)